MAGCLCICEQIGDKPFLFITLPSGRRLAYPFVKLITNRFNRRAVEFFDNPLTNASRGIPAAGRHAIMAPAPMAACGLRMWFQAIARDLLAGALPRLEAAGYPVVAHVHDESALRAARWRRQSRRIQRPVEAGQ